MLDKDVHLQTGDVLRASDVKRWQIVSTTRNQSLSDHTYGVAVIAMELARRLWPGDIELLKEVALAAIIHDLPEVITGDIPTPVKEGLGIKGTLNEVESRLLYCGLSYQDAPEQARMIVKAADLIESIRFLDQHGNMFSRHTTSVRNKLYRRLAQGSLASELYHELADHTPNEFDDLI